MTTFVYLAGPMRGLPYFNNDAFFKAEEELQKGGDLFIFNPARRDLQTYGPKVFDSPTGDIADITPLGFDMRRAFSNDLVFISTKADSIHMLKGWSRSKGATAERATALALGLTVTYEDPNEYRTSREHEEYDQGYDDALGAVRND